MKPPSNSPVPDPFPPALSEADAGTGEMQLDALDTYVLGRLTEPRLFRAGAKKIIRGRLDGSAGGREAFARDLKAQPVNVFFERVDGATFATVSRPPLARVPENWPLHLALFIATLFTTAWGGAYWNGIDPFAGSTLARPDLAAIAGGLRTGLPFALALLAILTCHEFGHYFAARRYGLDASLPFYVPVPPFFSSLGTLGAVIKMRTPLYNRRILLDVGAAGPLAGMAAALPILVYGILHAPVAPDVGGPGIIFNEPLLFSGLERLLRPDVTAGTDIEATSLVLAGWLGIFVTALNLLPAGQLDGGHVVYALVGERQRWVGGLCFATLAGLGWLWMGWWVWAVLILLVVRIRHPRVPELDLPLGRRRTAIGWLTLALFVLCFHPVPFSIR
ncbi:MAG: site-2 protease family protein [Gemmatimonadetes bacterium]|nr:site-2 protease family protein [Gemmatimonadota bacterium]